MNGERCERKSMQILLRQYCVYDGTAFRLLLRPFSACLWPGLDATAHDLRRYNSAAQFDNESRDVYTYAVKTC
jgi:hypothetical protein